MAIIAAILLLPSAKLKISSSRYHSESIATKDPRVLEEPWDLRNLQLK